MAISYHPDSDGKRGTDLISCRVPDGDEITSKSVINQIKNLYKMFEKVVVFTNFPIHFVSDVELLTVVNGGGYVLGKHHG